MNDKLLHDLKPREDVGRDTISRYRAQHRAAAYESLSILAEKIDRVYCDYHDDFVTRKIVDGSPRYCFFQVKTKKKRNYLWSISDIAGLNKRKKQNPDKMAKSFLGLLLLHVVRFESNCHEIIFLTNINFSDEVVSFCKAIVDCEFDEKYVSLLINDFNAMFPDHRDQTKEEIKENLKKIKLIPNIYYLAPEVDDFGELICKKIFNYSEVDLKYSEGKIISNNLMSLVEKKSFRSLLLNITQEELDEIAGIGINDLLDILSLSRGAYESLKSGGDPSALKSISILQRKLEKAGASEEVILFCAELKTAWDSWWRDKRHSVPEFDLIFLEEKLNSILKNWIMGEISFTNLKPALIQVWDEIKNDDYASTLSKDILLGGIFSAFVRSEAQ